MQSLTRGLSVIKCVIAGEPCTLHHIHLETGLPKPTLLRILETLEAQGVIFRPIDDRRYRISNNSFLFTRERDIRTILQEVAVPVLSRMCKDIAWPTDLTVRDGHRMVVVASNRMLSPFPIKPSPHGHQPDMLLTAVGRAYLAFCSTVEKDEIIASIRKEEPAHSLIGDMRGLEAMLEETRKLGYGVRSKFKHDGFSAIAVPIMVRDVPLACMNLFYYKRAVSLDNITSDHLARLQQAAQEISRLVEPYLPSGQA
jgi:IclR family mhp operon transcriptional activator